MEQNHDVQLLATAARRDQWPESDLPEILFAGRSNAGKSSLINALVNRKNLAYVGSTPGKTVLLNFFEVDGQLVFTDAPGYGYAKGGTKSIKDFARLLDPYFKYRPQLKALIMVLDIRRVPNSDDLAMVDYARNTHLPILAACVKADKLSRSQQLQQIKVISTTLNIRQQSCIPVSSLKKTGIDEMWEAIHSMIH